MEMALVGNFVDRGIPTYQIVKY